MTTREDGRRPDELRPLQISVGAQAYAEGSALIELGATRVLCAASVEESVPAWLRGQGRGWVTGEYAMLPRATLSRTRRERNGPGGRTQEIQRLIGRALRAAVDLGALGERTITVDCDVLQADGGTRTASITGGYVALALALRRLRTQGLLADDPLVCAVAAVSVGIVDEQLLLDLAYGEDSRAGFDCNIVATDQGAYVEVQGTAEAGPITRARLDELLKLADLGLARMLAAQQDALRVQP